MKHPHLSTVVVIDDDPESIRRISEVLIAAGYQPPRAFLSPEEGLEYLRSHARETLAVLLDVMFGDHARGLDTLQEICSLPFVPPVLMLSAHERARLIETALKRGADAYVAKDDLESLPERLESYRLKRSKEFKELYQFLRQFGILTQSESMRKVAEKIQRCAPTELTVLIVGETGTGKSLVARALHQYSRRSNGPFVTVDIPNVSSSAELLSSRLFGTAPGAFTGAPPQGSPGFFHEADGGTLFLDEIGELSREQQSTLLKPVEEKRFCRVGSTKEEQVDIRIISATNRDIAQMVDTGGFRRDLYERLAQEIIFLPPLRERREDIPLLATYFAQTLPAEIWRDTSVRFQFADATLEELQRYPWDGNVRQLQNVVRRCLILAEQQKADSITPRILREALSSEPRSDSVSGNNGTLGDIEQKARKERIKEVLEKYRGNMTKAARELRVTRTHLHRLCRQYKINPQEYRSR